MVIEKGLEIESPHYIRQVAATKWRYNGNGSGGGVEHGERDQTGGGVGARVEFVNEGMLGDEVVMGKLHSFRQTYT